MPEKMYLQESLRTQRSRVTFMSSKSMLLPKIGTLSEAGGILPSNSSSKTKNAMKILMPEMILDRKTIVLLKMIIIIQTLVGTLKRAVFGTPLHLFSKILPHFLCHFQSF